MVENFVPDTADDVVVVALHEAGKIGQAADPKQQGMVETNLSDLEDAIADAGEHQGDMVEENVLEREIPIVDDIRHQENVPVLVDTTDGEIVR